MKQIELTQSMKQFVELTEKKPNAVVFFGIGDDYVTYQESARIASEILVRELKVSDEVAWTDGTPFVECSFPICMANSMVGRLVKAGKCVVLCDQPEKSKPQDTRSLLERCVDDMKEKNSVKKC